MDVRTGIKIQPAGKPLAIQDPIMTIGSCFSQVMGLFLRENKFNVLANPFGTVYNPYSIHELLWLGTKERSLDPSGYVNSGEVFFHYNFHSDSSELSKKVLAQSLEKKVDQVHSFLKRAEWLIITYGTSIVYKNIELNKVVANCHKVPQNEFVKEYMTTEEIKSGFEALYSSLKTFNSDLKIILTVSPVRHIKDGLTSNAYSKAVLRVACQELSEIYDDVHYFPSFEIMIDDLRDYRYYGHDLIHPNELAEEYIWERFCETYLSKGDLEVLKKWDKVRKSMNHRPRHPETVEYKLFLKSTLDRLKELNEYLDLKSEIAQVRSLLK